MRIAFVVGAAALVASVACVVEVGHPDGLPVAPWVPPPAQSQTAQAAQTSTPVPEAAAPAVPPDPNVRPADKMFPPTEAQMCASDRAKRIDRTRAWRHQVADAQALAASRSTREAWAKAHCKIVTRLEQTTWRDNWVDARGVVHSDPVAAEDQRYHCPKNAPPGVEGMPVDLAVGVFIPSQPPDQSLNVICHDISESDLADLPVDGGTSAAAE